MDRQPSLPTEFQIEVTGGRLVLAGEVDIACVPQVEEGLAQLEGQALVVVDLSSVSFMDSSGVASLVRGRERIRESDGRLRVENAQPPVRRVIELMGLAELLG